MDDALDTRSFSSESDAPGPSPRSRVSSRASSSSSDRSSVTASTSSGSSSSSGSLTSSGASSCFSFSSSYSLSSTETPPPKRRCVCDDDDDNDDIGEAASESDAKGDGGGNMRWLKYTTYGDWARPRLLAHYDDDLDEHHPEVDVTHERALWKAYVRSGTRIPTNDTDVLLERVIEFAGDFMDDEVYDSMEALEPGPERRRWVLEQRPEVRADRARRSRLLTVIADALERDDEGDFFSDDDDDAGDRGKHPLPFLGEAPSMSANTDSELGAPSPLRCAP